MKKLFNKIRKINKGFTLVELIIVIAVMAVLTVVVAPQYLKYIEKSRVATDENAIGELKHIVEVTYIEAEADGVTDTNVIINIGADGKFTYPNADEELDSRVKDIYPEESYEFKSKTWKGYGDVEFTVEPETGLATHDGPTGPGSINVEGGENNGNGGGENNGNGGDENNGNGGQPGQTTTEPGQTTAKPGQTTATPAPTSTPGSGNGITIGNIFYDLVTGLIYIWDAILGWILQN